MWHYPTKNDSHFCSFFVTVQFCGPPTKKSKKSSHTFGMDTRKSAAPFAFQNQSRTIFYHFKQKTKTFSRLFLLLHFNFSFCEICREEARPGCSVPAGCLCLARRRIRSCPARLQAVAIISIHSHSPSSARELVSAKQYRGWHVTCQEQWPDHNVASVTNTDTGGKYLIIW